ncbi:hypothetical protein KM043_010054 [Ampulex compressa]|nr:hypothetical protein KM043_010054 [Ampulex compressa]
MSMQIVETARGTEAGGPAGGGQGFDYLPLQKERGRIIPLALGRRPFGSFLRSSSSVFPRLAPRTLHSSLWSIDFKKDRKWGEMSEGTTLFPANSIRRSQNLTRQSDESRGIWGGSYPGRKGERAWNLPLAPSPLPKNQRGPPLETRAVLQGTAELPCDIRPPRQNDSAILVVWYKSDMTPIYSGQHSGPANRTQEFLAQFFLSAAECTSALPELLCPESWGIMKSEMRERKRYSGRRDAVARGNGLSPGQQRFSGRHFEAAVGLRDALTPLAMVLTEGREGGETRITERQEQRSLTQLLKVRYMGAAAGLDRLDDPRRDARAEEDRICTAIGVALDFISMFEPPHYPPNIRAIARTNFSKAQPWTRSKLRLSTDQTKRKSSQAALTIYSQFQRMHPVQNPKAGAQPPARLRARNRPFANPRRKSILMDNRPQTPLLTLLEGQKSPWELGNSGCTADPVGKRSPARRRSCRMEKASEEEEEEEEGLRARKDGHGAPGSS